MVNNLEIPTPLEVFEALVKGDEAVLYSLPRFKSSGWYRCPLCSYTTNATNIHRSCPLAPIDPTMPKRGVLGGRLMGLNMYPVEAPKDGDVIHPRTVPSWDRKQWEWYTNPKEWEEIVREFLKGW